jgi:hypothetical protein
MFFRGVEPYIALILMLATTVFALWKGGPPERLGAATIIVVWIGTVIAQALTPPAYSGISLLVSDGLAAVGFLVVAIRFSSLWLGGAMMCEAAAFVAHAMRLSDNERIHWHGANVYVLIVNVSSYLVLSVLIGGTVATIQRRRRADREKVEDRARIVKRPDWLTDAAPPTAGAL